MTFPVGQGDGYPLSSSDSEGEEKDDGKKTVFRLDDWLAFRLDNEVRLNSWELTDINFVNGGRRHYGTYVVHS